MNSRISNIVNHAYQIGLETSFVDKYKLEKFCSHQPHQGVVLKCDQKRYAPLNQVLMNPQGGELVVLLDQITDPQNFGAILRSCFYLGVQKVLVENQSKCPLTTTVSKTSAGALELMDIYSIKNSLKFLEDSIQGGWMVYATGISPDPKKLIPLDQLEKQDLSKNIILMLGSENVGLSTDLLNIASGTIWIERQKYCLEEVGFPETLVESLNVNSAASIIIQTLRSEQIKQLKNK